MPKILLVEDDVFIAEIYEKKLSSAGFELDNVTTGRDALKRLQEHKYDLVLLDLVLPEMSGFDILREVRGKEAEYPGGSKIIVFSNLSSPHDREQAIQAGADGFISKTEFTPTEVVDEIKRFLRQFSEQGKRAARNGDATGKSDVVTAGDAPILATGKKILLIEDEEVFAEMFGKRLLDEGYAVVTESDGRAALDRALNETFDLVITDAILPHLDGREIIKALRADEKTARLPIFLLSASLLDDELQALEASGAVNRSFLKTKITPSELADTVSDYFKS